jgi:hypothetical protein
MANAAISTFKPKKNPCWRWFRRLLALACVGVLLFVVLLFALVQLLLNRVPSTYRAMDVPIPAPEVDRYASLHLDGFESPYLGHTGSANGKGGAVFGGSKASDLDAEAAMGLRWTFLPVNWSAIEPAAAVDLSPPDCAQVKQLDEFVIVARQRKLNIFLQIVIGGNAGGPPAWAGRREAGKSAPGNMAAAAAFAGKLAARYAPGGILARREQWPDSFGVRAWELDNEPEGYRTSWSGQAGDYAEFATQSASAIRAVDARAMIAIAATAGGGNATPWLSLALDASQLHGSPFFNTAGVHCSIGPVANVVSFHCYEGLEAVFNRTDRTIVDDLAEVRDVFDQYRTHTPGFTYASKTEYWHTEGNFDFLGVLSAKRRAAWRFQFMTRAFAAGVSKVCVMDPSTEERAAVKAYIAALPRPFPMEPADDRVKVLAGRVSVFHHPDAVAAEAGQVWIVWALAGTGNARVKIPVSHDRVKIISIDGTDSFQNTAATHHQVTIDLQGDSKMAPAVIVSDRAN